MGIPDADIFPHATGNAKAIVDQHTKDEELTFYAGWFCPFVQRAWAILEEKNIPYKYVEINPYHKAKEFLALNPRGLVPTVEYHNKPLYESTVICDFLEEAYPNHGPPLLPKDPFERAQLRIWNDYVSSRIVPAFHRFLQNQSGTFNQTLDEARQEYLGKLKEFTLPMDKEGPFFAGKEPCLVDFTVAPWVVRNWAFDEFKEGGLGIPAPGSGGDDDAIWNRYRKFQSAIEQRPSIHNTLSDKEHYLPLYERYHLNKSQSEMAKATRAGKGVP